MIVTNDVKPYNPLRADHPLVTREVECQACHQKFVAGDITCLVPLGPGDNLEAREKARNGRPFNAIALPIHYACATGEEG